MTANDQPRNALVFNMANEGIPLAAIARVLGATYDAVKELVTEAVDAGRLLHSPPYDWPDHREKMRALCSLDSMVEVQVHLKRQFNFPPREALLCSMLMHVGQLKRDEFTRLRQMTDGESDNVEDKTLDVYICHLRKRLSILGIQIETIAGSGYALTFPEKQRLFDLLFGEAEEEDEDMDVESRPPSSHVDGGEAA